MKSSLTFGQLKKYADDLKKIHSLEKSKRVELELSNAKLKQVINSINSGILTVNINLEIIELNDHVCKIIDRNYDDLLGKTLAEVLPGASWSKIYGNLPSKENPDEMIIDVSGESSLYYRVARSSIFGEKNNLLGWVFLFTDETENVRNKQIKEEFFALVSHEIRTPITVLQGYIEILNSFASDRLSEEEKSYLITIKENTNRLVRTVKELLDTANLSLVLPKSEMKKIDFCGPLADAIKDVTSVAAGKKVEFHFEGFQKNCLIFGDREMLQTSIKHLLENSLEFSPSGSTITINLKESSNNWVLSVKDEGSGIPVIYQDKIFEPMFQVEGHMTRTHEGVGLGLFIVRRTAALHGGSVSIISAVGAGTEVIFKLPVFTADEKDRIEKQYEFVKSQLEEKIKESKKYQEQMMQYAQDFGKLFKKGKESKGKK